MTSVYDHEYAYKLDDSQLCYVPTPKQFFDVMRANTIGYHDYKAGSSLAARVNRAISDQPEHAAGRHLLSVIQAATNN